MSNKEVIFSYSTLSGPGDDDDKTTYIFYNDGTYGAFDLGGDDEEDSFWKIEGKKVWYRHLWSAEWIWWNDEEDEHEPSSIEDEQHILKALDVDTVIEEFLEDSGQTRI